MTLLRFVRYGLPAGLVLAGFVLLFVAPESTRYEGFALLRFVRRRLLVESMCSPWVAQHRKPALVPDVIKDPRWLHLPDDDDTQRKSTGSMIAVPLIAQHDTLGVLLLSHDDIGYFNEGHLRLLSASAGEIALGIHNALLFDQIERQLLHQGEMRRRPVGKRNLVHIAHAAKSSWRSGVFDDGASLERLRVTGQRKLPLIGEFASPRPLTEAQRLDYHRPQ